MEESTTSSSGYLPAERSGFLLSEEETHSLNSVPYGSIMNDQGSVSATTILQHPLRWIVPNSDSTIEAAYVAVLHPPVVVAEDVAKQLAALSNQAGMNTTMGFHKDPGYLSLQECLLLRQQLAFNALFQSCFKETVPVDETKKRLAAILPGVTEDLNVEVAIVIQTPQPPNVILASFLNPYTESNMIIEVLIDAGTGSPTVRLINGTPTASTVGGISEAAVIGGSIIGNSGLNTNHKLNTNKSGGTLDHQQFMVEGEKLTKVLQTCDSIPILVRWVLKRSHNWMKERNLIQGKGQSQLGRRTSSYTEEGGILKRPRV
ncbi:hypothetical protein BGX27_003030 [Mortierella sp. AM989]|nr:hypothetical protein BGX27_003030 [Mortierella sp. AM989]